MRVAALLTALMLLTAGCIGMGGDEGDSDAETASTDAPGTSPGTNATEATNGSHGHEPTPERHFINITGELSGVNAVAATTAFGNETVELPKDPNSASFTIKVDSGELFIEIYPPDCEDENELVFFSTQGPDCATSGSTMNGTSERVSGNGGTFAHSAEDPKGGNWTIELQKSDAGANAVSYTIVTEYVDIHKPGGNHHS